MSPPAACPLGGEENQVQEQDSRGKDKAILLTEDHLSKACLFPTGEGRYACLSTNCTFSNHISYLRKGGQRARVYDQCIYAYGKPNQHAEKIDLRTRVPAKGLSFELIESLERQGVDHPEWSVHAVIDPLPAPSPERHNELLGKSPLFALEEGVDGEAGRGSRQVEVSGLAEAYEQSPL